MSESKTLTTNELYSIQRGQGGKFVSGRRIHNTDLPIGFYQENNTLILNYYDSSDKYIAALEAEKKEEFSALLKECLSDFDRAMHSDKFNAFSELINKLMRLLDKNKHNINNTLASFIQEPTIATSLWMINDSPVILLTFDKFNAVIDTQCQIIIASLLTSYKYDSSYFPRDENIFQHVDYILQQVKIALHKYLFGVDGAVPRHSTTCNVIYSRLAELIKNGTIDEDAFTTLSDIILLTPFSMLKQIIDDTEISNINNYNQGIIDLRMITRSVISKQEMLVHQPLSFDDTSDDLIFKSLITMYKKVKSISDMKEYLLSTITDNDKNKDTGKVDIVKTLLSNLDIIE